jgi:hypothetical protein
MRGFLFPDTDAVMKKATLKPQYAEYVRLYGFPEGGLFDMDRLGAIITQLGIQ